MVAQGLGEVLRKRIQRSSYWLGRCADASFLDVIGLAADLDYVEGMRGEAELAQPTPFVCLLQRLVQLDPPPELLDELIRQDDLKYVRLLAIVFVRLTVEDPVVVHAALDVGLGDYRTLRLREPLGAAVEAAPFDVVVEAHLGDERQAFMGVPLPSLLSRANTAVATGQLLEWPRTYDSPAE
jgi:pre-mRNA-splicing factor 38A